MLTDRMADHAAMQQYLQDLSGDNSAWRAAFRAAFFRAMREALTQRQYDVLRLHYIEGLPQKEIAAQWGISPSAVCRHLARGKKKLRQLLSYNLEWRA